MYNTPLEPGTYYHVFNHAIGDDSLFRQADNYRYFLERYRHYIFPVFRTYAYCLMPNHFHILIQVSNEEKLRAHFITLHPTKQIASLVVDYPAFVMQQFSNLFNSYAKSFSRRFDRKGALFLNYVRRKPVLSEAYFTTLLAYIHCNPVHHNFCRRADDWAYSSLHSIVSEQPTRLERSAVLDWFGGIEPFIAFHQQASLVPSDEDWEFGNLG